MQQDKNIQNKLQQLENQQLPDLSHMDEHWQQMQSMLAAPPAGGSGGGKVIGMNRWIWITSALIIIAGIIFFTQKRSNSNEEKRSTVASESNVSKPIVLDSEAIAVQQSMQDVDDNTNHGLKFKPISWNGTPDFNISVGPLTVDTSKQMVNYNPQDLSLKAVHPDRQQLLNNLLSQLAKDAQQFSIDNSRDTLLTGTEGSTLLIPANSLGGSRNVIISLKEFYKTSDIVLNKLSTSSNGNQLITGGMVHITASVNGQEVNIQPGKQIRLYMTDTSAEMKQMQQFEGEEVDKVNQVQIDKDIVKSNFSNDKLIRDKSNNINTKSSSYINWIPRNQYFQQQILIRKAKVFNLANDPYKIENTTKGDIAYFKKSDDSKLTRRELAKLLKAKYGYYKVRVKNSWRAGHRMFLGKFLSSKGDDTFDNGIGDTAWMPTDRAIRFKLPILGSQRYTKTVNSSSSSSIDNMLSYVPKAKGQKTDATKEDVFAKLENKYYIDINKLGWINCDHFSNKSNLVEYAVNLGDSAQNYYTILVFSNIRSMMSGYLAGNDVVFSNIPKGEKVKIISIGINKIGNTVMAVKDAAVSDDELKDLPFEEVNADKIKSSLSIVDK